MQGETSTLTTWVSAGAVPDGKSTHPGQWNDRALADWHGAYLRSTDWQPIIDPERGDACGLCHMGSPAPVDASLNYPPGATDCTDCHSLPGGVMACGTCHGDGLRAYPPRDQCYFRGPPAGYAHEPHSEPSANNPSGLDCQACHFGEDFSMLCRYHGDGQGRCRVPAGRGPGASYDFDTKDCTTTCHVRGGTTPNVAWDDLGLICSAMPATRIRRSDMPISLATAAIVGSTLRALA